MVQEEKNSPLTWRIVTLALVIVVCMASYQLNESFRDGPPQEDPVAMYYSEVYEPGPWKEVSRVTSPDGELDAILAQNSKQTDDKRVLFVLPSGETPPTPSPYRSYRTFLKRMVRDTPFVAVKATSVQVAWSKDSELVLTGQDVVYFGNRKAFEVQLGPSSRTIQLANHIENGRFSQALGVDWESES